MAAKHTEEQALDPGTPGEVLQQIALDEPALRPAIARNPATYPALLEWLASLGDAAVDEALAARSERGAPPDLAGEGARSARERDVPGDDACPATQSPGPEPPGALPPAVLPPAGAAPGRFAALRQRKVLWAAIAAAVVLVAGGIVIAVMSARGGGVAASVTAPPAASAAPTPSDEPTMSESPTPSPTLTETPSPTAEASDAALPAAGATPTGPGEAGTAGVAIVEPDLALPENAGSLSKNGNLLLLTIQSGSDIAPGVAAFVWAPQAPGKVTAIERGLPEAPDELKWEIYGGSDDAEPSLIRVFETRTPSQGLTPEKFHWFAQRIDPVSAEVISTVPIDLSGDTGFDSCDVWAVGETAFICQYQPRAVNLKTGARVAIPAGSIKGSRPGGIIFRGEEGSFALDPATLKVKWRLPDTTIDAATDRGWDEPSIVTDQVLSYRVGLGSLSSGAFEQPGANLSSDAYPDFATGAVLGRYVSDGTVNGWYLLGPDKLDFSRRFITTNLASDLDLDVHAIYDGVIYVSTTDQILSVQLDGTVLSWGPWQWTPKYRIGPWTALAETGEDGSVNSYGRIVLVKDLTKEMLTESLVPDMIEGPEGNAVGPQVSEEPETGQTYDSE